MNSFINFINEFIQRVTENTHGLHDKIKKVIKTNNKEHQALELTICINKLHSAIFTAYQKTYNLFNESNNNKPKKIKKTKYCWDKNLVELFARLRAAYVFYRGPNGDFAEHRKARHKEAKEAFKIQKNENIKIKAGQAIQKANTLLSLNHQKFWKAIKNIRTKQVNIDAPASSIMNEYRDRFTIGNECDENFKHNQVQEWLKFKETKKKDIFSIKISEMAVSEKINALKPGKSTGFSGVTNQMFRFANACPEISKSIKEIFEIMINHTITPKLFNIALLKPLVKDPGKSTQETNNLRPVAISDVISNLFESIILDQVRKDYVDDKLQLGFKINSSCAHSLFTLENIIKESRRLNKRLYLNAIDASKAFDKVTREILWNRMIELKFNPAIVLAIDQYYSKSSMIVVKVDEISNLFETKIGVRQGGTLSPELFKIYYSGVINLLQNTKGATIGSMRISLLLYADDLVLFSHTKQIMKNQLEVMEQFGHKFGIQYNPNKTVYMVFNRLLKKKCSRQNRRPVARPFTPVQQTY